MKSVHRGVRPGGRKRERVVRVLSSSGRLQVWLYEDGAPHLLAGSVDAALASDAERHGQDLVGELVDRALREADRRSSEQHPQ